MVEGEQRPEVELEKWKPEGVPLREGYAIRFVHLFRNRIVHLTFSSRTTKLSRQFRVSFRKLEKTVKERTRKCGPILFYKARKKRKEKQKRGEKKYRKQGIKSSYSQIQSCSVLYIGIHTRKVIYIYVHIIYTRGVCLRASEERQYDTRERRRSTKKGKTLIARASLLQRDVEWNREAFQSSRQKKENIVPFCFFVFTFTIIVNPNVFFSFRELRHNPSLIPLGS